MSYTLLVRSNAEKQAKEAHDWYEEKITGLGNDFLTCLDACISSIIRNPKIYQKKYKKIRMAIVDKFPYGIYYVVEGNSIIIFAVLHFSRNPKYLEK
ncbi:MAG: type II toxin-antitoxin system RelE/ParE family toxin [Bacteroidia bacterium]